MKGFEILTLKLKNITPTIIGGYRATTFSPSLGIAERFRVSELKGVWRWWFRALTAGALWDAYGRVDENSVREKVRAVLGSINSASKFILQAYAKKEEQPTSLSCNENLPPRLNLLCGKGKRCEKKMEEGGGEKRKFIYYYDVGSLEYSLKLLKQPRMRLEEIELRTGVSSLLMALTFQGIGAITRRGFGAWEIKANGDSVEGEFADEIRDYIQLISELNKAKSPENAEEIIRRLVQLAINDFSKFIGVSETKRSMAMNGIPPFSLVSRDDNIFKFRIELIKAQCSLDLLTKIGKATMSATWRSHSPNKQLHTWILGLPRGQKMCDQKIYGYVVDIKKSKFGRRPSAISIHPLKRQSGNEWICLVYGFLSKDWPRILYYISSEPEHKPEPRIDTVSYVREAFEIAFDMVRRCLRQ